VHPRAHLIDLVQCADVADQGGALSLSVCANNAENRAFMDMINRGVAIIKPKQPFLAWLGGLPQPMDSSLNELRKDCTAILIPDSLDDIKATGTFSACIRNSLTPSWQPGI
jgi:hypothetical protein